jgi:hypothetical protein
VLISGKHQLDLGGGAPVAARIGSKRPCLGTGGRRIGGVNYQSPLNLDTAREIELFDPIGAFLFRRKPLYLSGDYVRRNSTFLKRSIDVGSTQGQRPRRFEEGSKRRVRGALGPYGQLQAAPS